MDVSTATSEVSSSAIAEEVGRPMAYRPLEPDALGRVGRRIAEML